MFNVAVQSAADFTEVAFAGGFTADITANAVNADSATFRTTTTLISDSETSGTTNAVGFEHITSVAKYAYAGRTLTIWATLTWECAAFETADTVLFEPSAWCAEYAFTRMCFAVWTAYAIESITFKTTYAWIFIAALAASA